MHHHQGIEKERLLRESKLILANIHVMLLAMKPIGEFNDKHFLD